MVQNGGVPRRLRLRVVAVAHGAFARNGGASNVTITEESLHGANSGQYRRYLPVVVGRPVEFAIGPTRYACPVILTAQNLNSGIFPNGSSASLVSRLAAASL